MTKKETLTTAKKELERQFPYYREGIVELHCNVHGNEASFSWNEDEELIECECSYNYPKKLSVCPKCGKEHKIEHQHSSVDLTKSPSKMKEDFFKYYLPHYDSLSPEEKGRIQRLDFKPWSNCITGKVSQFEIIYDIPWDDLIMCDKCGTPSPSEFKHCPGCGIAFKD